MFEERTVSILAYNLEMMLAEKMEAVISRGVVNTRRRDYHGLYILQNQYLNVIDMEQFRRAFSATSVTRKSVRLMRERKRILQK